LTQIHRNAGSSVRACSAICDGLPWQFDEKLGLKSEDPKNFILVKAGKNQAQDKVLNLLAEIRDHSPFDAIWDTQVLVAVNKKSPLSRAVLNRKIQNLLNPAPENAQTPFRVGDKVVQREKEQVSVAEQRKDWKTKSMEWRAVNGEKTTIYKGEFGRVLFAEERRTVVQFFNPDRTVLIYRSSGSKKNVDDDEAESNEEDKEESTTCCNMDLGYAVTVHYMQGSQQKLVVYCIDEYPGASGQYGVCDRAHFYVGASRHTVACFMVGMKHVADAICAKRFIWRRKTFLADLIRGYAAKSGVELGTPREPGGPSIDSLFRGVVRSAPAAIAEDDLW
jgi:hypothetical protein